MAKKHRLGSVGQGVVVMNQELVSDPMKRYSNDALKGIESCSNCSIHTGAAPSRWANAGALPAGGAADPGREAAPAAGKQAGGREGGGAFIPFASGTPVTLAAASEGQDDTAAVIGFGNSADGVGTGGGSIDLSATHNMAFLLPESGRVTSFAAHFSTSEAIEFGDKTITVTARLYQSPSPGSLFTPVPGVMITLSPGFSGTAAAGAVCSGGRVNLSVPLARGTRLMAVFSAEAAAADGEAVSVSGYASAGLAIRQHDRRRKSGGPGLPGPPLKNYYNLTKNCAESGAFPAPPWYDRAEVSVGADGLRRVPANQSGTPVR